MFTDAKFLTENYPFKCQDENKTFRWHRLYLGIYVDNTCIIM